MIYIGAGSLLIIATISSAIEVIISTNGYFGTSSNQPFVPLGLAVAVRAMLFIVYKELIPESHGDDTCVFPPYILLFISLGYPQLARIFWMITIQPMQSEEQTI